MALIPCYECSREISDKAPACPQCGAPKKKATPKKKAAPKTKAASDFDRKTKSMEQTFKELDAKNGAKAKERERQAKKKARDYLTKPRKPQPQPSLRKPREPQPQQPDGPFYLAANGVTVMGPDADVGQKGEVNGIVYTKRSQSQIKALVAAKDYASLTTTCTSGVTDMARMFHNHSNKADAFNQDISSWDVSSVTNMNSMFYGTVAFNQDISSWDVSNVTDMRYMFGDSDAFNQKIGSWDVSKVTKMDGMFCGAKSFNQDLSGWCVSLITSKPIAFDTTYATSWVLPRPAWGTGPSKEAAVRKVDIRNEGEPDGPYESYHPNGQLEVRVGKKDGKWHGPAEAYYENGQLKEKKTYVAGEPNGPSEVFYENGQLQVKGTQVAGELDGPFEAYYENGQLQVKGTQVAGELDGPCEVYYENGRLKEKVTCVAGKKDGPEEMYYEDGRLQQKVTYVAGEKYGPEEMYYEDGQLQQKGTYAAGEPDGLFEAYYENGQLRLKGTYKMGERCGEWIEEKAGFFGSRTAVTVTHPPCGRKSASLRSASATARVTAAQFYLASNGVTVMCPDGDVGQKGEVNGIVYTKRSRSQIDALIYAKDYASLTTTCTSGVTNMRYMFSRFWSFNQDISSWDVSSVRVMTNMFYGATAFNQDLSRWCVSNITSMPVDFDRGATSWVLARPVWGTCPP